MHPQHRSKLTPSVPTVPRSCNSASVDGHVDVVIGLGANLGDEKGMFGRVVRELPAAAQVHARSRLYRSAAIGPTQPDFLNAAILVRSTLSLRELLFTVLALEARLGRVRRERWGPRVIDLDLLWAGSNVVSDPELMLPHPRLTERAFALRPLLDVVPDATDPTSGRPYTTWLDSVAAQRIEVHDDASSWVAGRG